METIARIDAIKGYTREFERLQSGYYTDLPLPVIQLLDKYSVRLDMLHFIHVSVEQPGMIAYTESARHAAADRQVRTKFGKYLTKYHKHLSVPQVAELSALLRGKVQSLGVQWARTQKEIRHVYENGPRSCMAYKASTFECYPYHPAEAYASEDIAIAYIERDGRITARTVCNMLEKHYTTFYGDGCNLRDLLDDAGFTYGTLDGCRMLRLESDNGLVLPYLDGCDGVDDMGDYFLCGGTDYDGTETNGLAEDRIFAHCDNCGDAIYSEDDCHSAYHGEETVCGGCVDWHYTWSDDTEDLVRCDDCDYVTLPSGDFVRYENVEEYGYCHCEDTGDLENKSDCVQLDSGDWILLENAVYCHIDDCWAHSDDATAYQTADGETRYTVGDPLDDQEHEDNEENDAA